MFNFRQSRNQGAFGARSLDPSIGPESGILDPPLSSRRRNHSSFWRFPILLSTRVMGVFVMFGLGFVGCRAQFRAGLPGAGEFTFLRVECRLSPSIFHFCCRHVYEIYRLRN